MRVLIAFLGLGLAACGTAASVAPPVPTPAPALPTSFTLVATGDFISQPELSSLAEAEGGFGRILGALAPMTSTADVAICHMETPFAGPGDPWTGYPIFNAPPVLADTTAALGYDSCSTASNHTVDYGWDGLVRTLDGLDRVGVKHAGSARSSAEASSPTLLDVHGVKVAHLSYTFSFNGLSLPEDKPWASNLIDVPAILDEAHRARAAGACVVVLSLHWGTEYMNEADVGQTGLASELLASEDIDLILGTHVHVVQPLEKLGSKWVAYGMGNVMVRFPDGSPENTQDAYATRYTFSLVDGRWQVSKVEVAPMWMEYYPVPRVVDLTAELAAGNARDDYQRAYDRIVQWTGAMGAPIEFVGAAGAPAHHKHGS